MGTMINEAYKTGGLVLVLVIVLFFISFFIIKHILSQSDRILTMAINSNERWQKTVTEITESIKAHDSTSAERGRYVREEHMSFMKNQGEILNIGKKTNECLDEVKEGLGRINGYKKE